MDEWKKQVFEKVKSEIDFDLDWEHFSKQVDDFVYVFGGGAYSEGKLPPHRKNEIWLRPKLEFEIIKQYKEAARQQSEQS